MLGQFIDKVSQSEKKKDNNWRQNQRKLNLVGKFASEQEVDLEPMDPSTGIIMSQGHMVFHLVYFIIINYFVEFVEQEGFSCFKFDDGTQDYVMLEQQQPEINNAVDSVKWIHLICFICMCIAENVVPLKVTSGVRVSKMFFGFITVPLYIFSILWLMSVDDGHRFKFTPDSTLDNFKAMGDFCIAKKPGNVRQWALIEITTFYMNLFSLMISLFVGRILQKDTDDEEIVTQESLKSNQKPLLTVLPAINSDSESDVSEFDSSELKNLNDYDEALDSVINSSDLLRHNESKLRFSSLHITYIFIGLFILVLLQNSNSNLHQNIQEIRDEALDLEDGSQVHKIYKQLEFDFKVNITKNPEYGLDWEYSERDIDTSKSGWILILLLVVHVISIIAFKLMRFKQNFITHQQWETFNRKFMILSIFLSSIYIGTFIVVKTHFNKVFTSNSDIGEFYYLWFNADLLLLFFTLANIYLEYNTFYKIQSQTSQYVIDKVQKKEEAALQSSSKVAKKQVYSGEILAKDKMVKLKLESDIYSFTYLKMHSDENPYVHGELMVKSFLTIVLQLMVMFLRFDEAIQKKSIVVYGSPQLIAVRLACAFFMHLQLYPEIEVSLKMIKYAVYHMENFKGGAFFPIIITLVKITCAIVAEIGSSFLLVQASSVSLALVFFMGMSIVANIDNIMAKTVTNFSISSEIANNPIEYKKGVRSFAGDVAEVTDWIDSGLPKLIFIPAGMILILNRVLSNIFTCIYFYFFPFLVLLFLEQTAYVCPDKL